MIDRKNMQNTTAILIILATVMFVIFNFSTTLDTLTELFGDQLPIVVFSIAIASVDFAGLARIYVTKNDDASNSNQVVEEDTDDLKKLLTTVWIIAMLADLFLTWLWGMIMAWRFTNSDLPPNIQQWGVFIAPAVLAIAEAAMRITLVASLAKSGRSWFYRASQKSAKIKRPERSNHRTPRPTPGQYNQPSDNYRKPKPVQAKSNSTSYRKQDYIG